MVIMATYILVEISVFPGTWFIASNKLLNKLKLQLILKVSGNFLLPSKKKFFLFFFRTYKIFLKRKKFFFLFIYYLSDNKRHVPVIGQIFFSLKKILLFNKITSIFSGEKKKKSRRV